MPKSGSLRLSTLFVRTLRDDPADGEGAGYGLLVRAGYLRRSGPGLFSWLPLGRMLLGNVERIVSEELERAGCQEVLVAGQPQPDAFTLLVEDICSSYRDLPVSLYQLETKIQGEERPRAGLRQSRQFRAVRSYSFDVDEKSRQASYDAHRSAFIRIFERLELPFLIVAGAPATEHFVAPLDGGGDRFVVCPGCHYQASTAAEIVEAPTPINDSTTGAAHVEDTPGTPTIQTLVEHLNASPELRRADRPWTAADTLKNVLVMLTDPDGTRRPLAVGLPGDRELDLRRLEARVAPARVGAFGDGDFAAAPQLVKGYIGPSALGEGNGKGVPFLVDPRVVDGSPWVTGANAAGRHVIDLVAGRDFHPDGRIDAAEIRDGDPCPNCGAGLTLREGINLAHIGKIGDKTVHITGPDGRPTAVTIGEYAIGTTRAVAVIAEKTFDDKGLCWPPAVAPADVHLVAAGKDQPAFDFCARLAEELSEAGVRVLYDDRAGVSAGVKFKDAELIGVPTAVVVGKGLSDGTVEVRDRRTGTIGVVAAGEVAGSLGVS
jgi:prolyl-tRNA synthetase